MSFTSASKSADDNNLGLRKLISVSDEFERTISALINKPLVEGRVNRIQEIALVL